MTLDLSDLFETSDRPRRRAERAAFPEAFPPRSLAYLGELGECVLRNPSDNTFHVLKFKPGRVLCAPPDGRELYVLKPYGDAGPVHADARALAVMDLHERFMQRRGSGFYNCFIPPFKRPRFAGEMAIITYLAQKADLDDAEWVHYFEGAEAPAYARLYDLGHDQYFFPRGSWRVTDEGIVYASEDDA